MMPTDTDLHAMTQLTDEDALRMFEAGDQRQHRRFVSLYRIAAEQGVLIPLEQLRFCFTKASNT